MKNIILFIISLFIGLILAVAASELFFQKKYFLVSATRFDSNLGWTTIPNYTGVEKGIRYTTNPLGFRSKEIDPSKDHVLVLGDSLVWGPGVNNNETASYYLGKLLPKFQVLNLGVSGYGIDQYFLHLKKNIGKLNPKLIIIVISTLNDFIDTSTNMGNASKPLFFLKGKELILYSKDISRYSCKNLLNRFKILRVWPSDWLPKGACEPHVLKSESAEKVIGVLLEKIHELSIMSGAKDLFILVPPKMDFILYSCRPTPLGALSNPAMCLRLEPKDIEMVSEILNLETSSLTASGKKKTRLLGQRSHIFEFEKILSRSGLEYFSFFKKIDFLIEKGLNLNDIYIDNHGHFTSRGHQGFAEMIFENIDLKRAS